MNNSVDVKFDASEAEAVLSILDKKANGFPIIQSDWDSLFASEGYILLKQREESIEKPFEDLDFINFVNSLELLTIREDLRTSLTSWREVNLILTAEKALTYLPSNTLIGAKVFPVIKPKTNSFVFDFKNNPAIFLYLDPQISPKQLENTLIHEMHHIGLEKARIGIRQSAEWNTLSPNTQTLLMWVDLFGEGLAMLAAAGGPKIHPHQDSNVEDRDRWDRDMLNYERDFREVEAFLVDVSTGRISGEAMLEAGNRFFGI